jgi:acyl carrier protein
VLDRPHVGAVIRETILTTWPHRFTGVPLEDAVSLGEEGLGLDSVEIAELLLTCEDRCGVVVSEELFTVPTLTIERVIEHFALA